METCSLVPLLVPALAVGLLACSSSPDEPSSTLVFADSGALLISVEVDGAATAIASTALHELGHT
jgi:hypothetical protein